MADFSQYLINGLVTGSVIAIVAMGFALIVNTTSIFHIAHAGTYVIGGYVAYSLIELANLPFWLAVILTIVACGLVGVIYQQFVYSRMRRIGSSSAGFLLASIGLTFIAQNLCAMIAGTYPKMFGQQLKSPIFFGFDNNILNINIILIILCVLTFVFYYILLHKTRIGLNINAVCSNPLLATTWGININWVFLTVFVIASLTVAPASLIHAMDVGAVPFAGWDVIVYTMIAYIIGGVGSVMIAGLAGLIIGIISSLLTWQIPTVWVPLIVFSIAYLFVWIRPKGILGRKMWSHEV